MHKPPCLVWLPMDHRLLGDAAHQAPFLVVGDKYARAVKDAAQAQPVLFPLADAAQIPALLALVDGVMLTGAPSNVHPSHFDEPIANPALPLDNARDTLTLSLARACVAQSVPLLGICRGFQEINVAFGGALAQQVHLLPAMLDHREPANATLAQQYAQRHEVEFVAGCVLAQWAQAQSAQVNSLHGQGIARLAPGLRALAHAGDGLVEAFAVEGARAFAYAVQWHPEWRFWENPFYAAIFKAFGQACQAHASARLAQSEPVLPSAARSTL